jgi:WD40 repeat protein
MAHYRSHLKQQTDAARTGAAIAKPRSQDPSVRLERLWQFRSHTGPIIRFRFLDSKLIASWSEDGTLRIWSSMDGNLRLRLRQ